MGAEKGAQGRRDREGAEEGRPRERFVQGMMEPRLGGRLLALGTGAVATGMMDAVVPPTAWARSEAVAIGPALALWDSAAALAGRGGEVGRVLQGLWGEGLEDVPQGGQGRRPGMRALRRSEASSWPWWVRCQETSVVASGVCPRERWMRRGGTPAASR